MCIRLLLASFFYRGKQVNNCEKCAFSRETYSTTCGTKYTECTNTGKQAVPHFHCGFISMSAMKNAFARVQTRGNA